MDEGSNRDRRLLRGFDRNRSTLHTFMQRQCWYVDNVLCCSSTPIASNFLAQRERGEINRIRIRKQSVPIHPPDGQKVRAARLRWSQVSTCLCSKLCHWVTVARCSASLLAGRRDEAWWQQRNNIHLIHRWDRKWLFLLLVAYG